MWGFWCIYGTFFLQGTKCQKSRFGGTWDKSTAGSVVFVTKPTIKKIISRTALRGVFRTISHTFSRKFVQTIQFVAALGNREDKKMDNSD